MKILACVTLSIVHLIAFDVQAANGSPDVSVVEGGVARSPSAEADIGSQIRLTVEKYSLANGLTVLLYEDHRVPLISYQTWFRVGSKDEEPGFTGIAHLFEHMMFQGAKRYTSNQFDTILQANGATNNAFTSYDYTGYYENLPSDKLELVIDIESDRMENLQISEANLASEREVVKEERRFRVDNSPMGKLQEALYGTAYRVHPYRWPVIGYMADLNNITLDKANQFFRQFYAPNNAVIVVAGDFKSVDAKRLLEKYYGKLQRQDIKRRPYKAEPAVLSARTNYITSDVQNTTFSVAFHAPKAGDADAYALDLLSNILGRGTSSRLYKRLVYRDQTVTSVNVFNHSKRDSGLFQVVVAMKPDADFQRVQRSVFGELWRSRNLQVTEIELEKAKNGTIKDIVDGLKTIQGKAEALALNEILFDDYTRAFTDVDLYNRVTVEDIRAVATKYLVPEASTLAVMQPKKSALKAVKE